MSNFGSVDEVLDFAIKREEESYEFYTDLAGRMDKPWISKIFEGFAREEQGHKAKLQGIKEGGTLASAEKKVMDLKVGDYLVDVEPRPGMDYQEALILAMKNEKAAFKLYHDLAATTEDDAVRGLFMALAEEEAKHKLRFELEYDETILREA